MAPFSNRAALLAASLSLILAACAAADPVPTAGPLPADSTPIAATDPAVAGGPPTSVIAEVWTNTPGPTPTTGPSATSTPILGGGAASGDSTPSGGGPSPQADCTNDSDFVADVTIPDGTRIGMGESFTKIWRLRNSGTCIWDAGYLFVLVDGSTGMTPTTDGVPVPRTEPGQNVEISVVLRVAPGLVSGQDLRATFQMRSPTGELFGTQPYVLIEVGPAPGMGSAAINGVVWSDYCSPGGMVEGTLREQKGTCIESPTGGQMGDGIRQPSEVGIPGVLVELRIDSCNGAVFVQGPTQADGTYTFPRLTEGVYCVVVDPQHNTNAGILIPGSFTAPADGTGTRIVTLTPGEIKTGNDFGWDDQFD